MSAALGQYNNDKLVSALFAMALLHGVLILGLSFNFVKPGLLHGSPSLEVILVRDPKQSDILPDDAYYLSEENQSGSGTTLEKVRAESQVTVNNPLTNPGTVEGQALVTKELPKETNMELIVSRSLSDFSINSLREKSLQQVQPEEAKLLQEQQNAPNLFSEFDEATQIHSPDLEQLFVSVNTKKSDLAKYLSLWKRKIEQVGTLNFPNQSLIAGMSGNPTLEVIIASNGYLEDVRIVASSGQPRIDQAAIDIVKLSSPFEAFPEDLAGRYHSMRFVYVWQFVDGIGKHSAVKLPPSN